MITFPNCKVNLGLNVIRKRADGYHDLESVFYPLRLKDGLEIIAADEVSFSMSGLQIEGNAADNLCLKAYYLLKQNFPELPAVKIHLHKNIPTGAGLGGGSADGAFMLLLLNSKFGLQLNEDQLIDYALKLGSDCPFFIKNAPVFATGRGEIMQSIGLNLSDYKFVLINPRIHISTKMAFANLTPAIPAKTIQQIIQLPVENWKNELVNDFEEPLYGQYPEINHIKNELYTAGAVYAAMSGSGSTVFGIYRKEMPVKVSFPPHYMQLHLPA